MLNLKNNFEIYEVIHYVLNVIKTQIMEFIFLMCSNIVADVVTCEVISEIYWKIIDIFHTIFLFTFLEQYVQQMECSIMVFW